MPPKNRPEDLLDWLGLKSSPDWGVAKPLGRFSGFIVSLAILVIPLLVLGALIAAGAVIGSTIYNVFNAAPNIPSSPNLGAGALIAALLGAPFVIWGTYIKYQSLGFQREGHITDRISKAVEQLGAEKSVKRVDAAGLSVEETVPNIEVRIGGLLSIERIAQDSVKYDKGRDHVRMMEILCAYIRNNAPASGAVAMPLEALAEVSNAPRANARSNYRSMIEGRTNIIRDWAAELPKPRDDIQLALSILSRRSADQRRHEARSGEQAAPNAEWVFEKPCESFPKTEGDVEEAALKRYFDALASWKQTIDSYRGYRLDLRNTNLQGAYLSGMNFAGANFSGAHLEGAVLWGTKLQGAALEKAKLQGADFFSGSLQGAQLSNANFDGARLGGANLQTAKAGNISMQGAEIPFTKFQRANLNSADLRGSFAAAAELQGAFLPRANLQGTFLVDAKLQCADLTHAALRGNGRYAQLEQKQANSAFGDASVHLPESVLRPDSWSQVVLADHDYALTYDVFLAELWLVERDSPDTYLPPS